MATNPRQHYLPAGFLARFSVDPNPDPRRRTLFVGQRPPGRTFQAVAERAGFVRGLYDDQLDEIWQGYEGPLPGALDQLSDGNAREVDAETWLRVLVPFAAALLLRGPDFEERFAERPVVKGLGDRMQGRPDPRPFELQRLLAPVLAARWVVIHTQEDELLLTSDTGWAPFIEPTRKRVACAIPLDTRTVLALVPNAIRKVFVWNTNRWMTPVQQETLAKDDYHIFRQNLADFATRQVFGPSLATIESVRENLDAKSWGPAEPFPFAALGGQNGPPNEFTWHRLLSAVRKQPADPELKKFAIDWGVVADGWHPRIILPLNLPDFPPSLHLREEAVDVRLYRVLHADPTRWILNDGVDTVQVMGPPL